MHYTLVSNEIGIEVKPEEEKLNDKKEQVVKEKQYQVKVIPKKGQQILKNDLETFTSFVSKFNLEEGKLNDKGEYVFLAKDLSIYLRLIETISVEFMNCSEDY